MVPLPFDILDSLTHSVDHTHLQNSLDGLVQLDITLLEIIPDSEVAYGCPQEKKGK